MITVFKAPYLDRISSLKQLEDEEPVAREKEIAFKVPSFDVVSGIRYERGIPPVYEAKDEFVRSDIKKKQDVSQIDEMEEDFEPPISDFLLRLKVMKEAPQIMKKSEEIKYHSGIEYGYAKSVLNARLNKISQVLISNPELIVDNGSNKTFSEYEGNNLKRVTTFTNDENGISIKRIDIINQDATKDIVLVGEGNKVIGIRLGYKQIGPKSYLEKSQITYKNGKVVSYCDNSSCINDGVAKSKTKSKQNLYKFDNGLLTMFVPKIDFAGDDSFSKKVYLFSEGKIKKYIGGLSIEGGIKYPKREIVFDD